MKDTKQSPRDCNKMFICLMTPYKAFICYFEFHGILALFPTMIAIDTALELKANNSRIYLHLYKVIDIVTVVVIGYR